jgi:hypothetical protein
MFGMKLESWMSYFTRNNSEKAVKSQFTIFS